MEINCCVLALIAFIGNIIQLVFFFNYSLKIKDKSIRLEKQEIKNNERIKELEQKNGKELKRIEEVEQKNEKLTKKVKELEIEKIKEAVRKNLKNN